jgi:hypothetical protein
VPETTADVEAWVRSSANVSSFYMSLFDADSGRIFWEAGPLAGKALTSTSRDEHGYKLLSYKAAIEPIIDGKWARLPSFRLGFWGNGQDAWVQVDDVYTMCGAGTTYPPSQEEFVPPPGTIQPCAPPWCIELFPED